MSDARDAAASLSYVEFHDLARALNLTLATSRKAQGKRNPSEMEPGTAEWHAVVEDFAADLVRYGCLLLLPMGSSANETD
ncbi:hypothetical protein AWB80_07362 [Caballeronia pedi]|uniref:Uncharacterized protein n=1 Tax=Caballeronia pedi TaxID=1777141 RepID=A0A158DSD8_9BURK|nr:hypothetical protein [Caballeronia pedi]SAK97488.1 hypothetical protein AWB80_07362 [Caballeronia pedi]